MTNPPFWDQMLGIAECLCHQITQAGLPEPCFCGVIAGEAAILDYCEACEGGRCGQAWVRLASVEPTLSLTGGITNPCTVPMQATIEVGIGRCAPGPSEDGDPPTMADQLEASAQQVADMNAALRAVRCCDAITGKDFDIVGWLPIGPEGGCLGGAWTITVYGA